MILRIYETKDIDLDTVELMLFRADKQANFHPESSWILHSLDNEINNYNHLENEITKKYKEFHVKWIGREAVIMWLVSNQVMFEIISFKLLVQEIEALASVDHEEEKESEQALFN